MPPSTVSDACGPAIKTAPPITCALLYEKLQRVRASAAPSAKCIAPPPLPSVFEEAELKLNSVSATRRVPPVYTAPPVPAAFPLRAQPRSAIEVPVSAYRAPPCPLSAAPLDMSVPFTSIRLRKISVAPDSTLKCDAALSMSTVHIGSAASAGSEAVEAQETASPTMTTGAARPVSVSPATPAVRTGASCALSTKVVTKRLLCVASTVATSSSEATSTESASRPSHSCGNSCSGVTVGSAVSTAGTVPRSALAEMSTAVSAVSADSDAGSDPARPAAASCSEDTWPLPSQLTPASEVQ